MAVLVAHISGNTSALLVMVNRVACRRMKALMLEINHDEEIESGRAGKATLKWMRQRPKLATPKGRLP